MNELRSKELQLARERGEQIVKIKAQRDRLEKERERIMDDLDKVKSGNMPAIRRNDAARIVGDQAIKHNNVMFDDARLEPSLKDKLIND